jgi:site-specific DNA recombinase
MTIGYYLRASKARDIVLPDGTITTDTFSVETQRQQCDRVRAAKGWTGTVVEYIDNDTPSNGKTARPAWAQMFADVRDGAITKIVVAAQDRLTRWPRDGEDFLELIAKHGVAVANYGGDVDLSTDNGRMIFRILCATARGEVERKGARQRAANQRRAHEGKQWTATRRSFGYDDGRIVEAEAAAIVEAAEALLSGASLRSIASRWNAAGLLTVEGKQWTGVTVRQTMVRPAIAGLAVYRGEILPGVEAAWPAIITTDVREAILTLIANPSRKKAKRPGSVFLGSGLYVCGNCGQTMNMTNRATRKTADRPDGGRKPVYGCRHCGKIVRDLAKTDAHVIKLVTGRLARRDAVAAFSAPTIDKKALLAQLKVLEQQQIQTKADYDDDLIDARDRNAKLDKIAAKMAPIEAKLLGHNTGHTVNGIAGNANAAEIFDKLPLDRKRAVIRAVADVTILAAVKRGEAFNPARVEVAFKGAD